MKQNKDLDAVKIMRKIHKKLSEKYQKNPELLKQEMQKIREERQPDIPELTVVK